jgi:hypothetical protein
MLKEPEPISYDWLNQFVFSLGFGDTSDPGTNQVRMDLISLRFVLRVWDGSNWVYLNDGVLDAATLAGMQPSTSASGDTIVQRNSTGHIHCTYLNTSSGASTNPTHLYGSQDDYIRKVTPQQLVTFLLNADGSGSGLDADLYRGAKIQYGTMSNAKDTGIYVYFPEAFSSTPIIILTPRAEVTVWKTNVSTTYCKIYAASTTNKTVDWLAIG